MSNETLVAASERMAAGDDAATEAIIRAYEPYLRMVVRRQLTASSRVRARFDSHDVVQSVWAETLQKVREGRADWRFADEGRLRSFLVRLTRNRLVDFYRRHRVSLAREQPIGSAAAHRLAAPRGDRPSEQLQAEELWSRLLSACKPSHRELLQMKALGATLAEIAERTGFHEGSVRRILSDLSTRVAAEAPELLPTQAP